MTLETRFRQTFRQNVSHHVMREERNQFNSLVLGVGFQQRSAAIYLQTGGHRTPASMGFVNALGDEDYSWAGILGGSWNVFGQGR
jgi:hypothetical protein